MGDTNRLGVFQRLLVHLEHTNEIGAEIGEDEEVPGGIKNGFVRAGLGLLRPCGVCGGVGEDVGLNRRNGRRIGNVEGGDTASLAVDKC